MHSTVDSGAIATTTTNCNSITVHIPQKRANYRDKARVRLKDIKAAALKECKCRDAKEMKQRLRHLGIKLDLRLTSAWCAIAWELKPVIEKLAKVVLLKRKPRLVGGSPAKRIDVASPPSNKPVFLNDFDAMTWYIAEYGSRK